MSSLYSDLEVKHQQFAQGRSIYEESVVTEKSFNGDLQDFIKQQEGVRGNSRKRKRRKKYQRKPPKYHTKSPVLGYQQLKDSQVKQKRKFQVDESEKSMFEQKQKRSLQRSQFSQEEREVRKIIKLQAKEKDLNPFENDLCEALMHIKRRLPNRSLQKVVQKLYEKVENEEKEKQGKMINENTSQQKEISENDWFSQLNHLTQVDNFRQHPQMHQNSIRPQSEIPSIKKVVIPGKKISIYHDAASSIACITNQQFKNNFPTQEDINYLERNDQAVVARPLPENEVTHQVRQVSQKQTNKEERFYHFKESHPRKLTQEEQQYYEKRRELTKLFVERGYSVSKQIEQILPSEDGVQRTFRAQLAGIMTSAFRKLQSFLSAHLELTIKQLQMQEMKRIQLILLNMKQNLEPACVETFIKVLRMTYGLGDVVISRGEAIELYVAIMKYLKGKDTTLQKLINLGKINQKRKLNNQLKIWKKYAQNEQLKRSKASKTSRVSQDMYPLSNNSLDGLDKKKRKEQFPVLYFDDTNQE